jgi:phenylalanyl-tRNA synthetase beta chain
VVARNVGLEGRVIAGEIDIAPLLVDRGAWVYAQPSPYPPQVFDLAFDVTEDAHASAVMRVVTEAAGDLLERTELFDVYTGEAVGDGRKSIAVKLTLRAPDRTLSDEEIAPLLREIAAAVEAATGGTLRGEL